jgi:hypothetical protein
MKVEHNESKATSAPVKGGCPDAKKDMVGYLKYMRDKDREMVRGIFRFFEVPDGFMSFVFKAYKEDDIERYDMYDGQIYTIPLGVAKHLNKNGWYPEHAFITDEEGKPMAKIGKKIRRFGFQSLEFFDESEIQPDIITVQKI